MVAHNMLAGNFTGGERSYFAAAINAIDRVIEQGRGFSSLLSRISAGMRDIRRHDFDADAAIRDGIAVRLLDPSPQEQENDALTSSQCQFLEDVKGLIQFVLRNGLDPNRVWIAISHDAAGIMRHQFSIERAADDESFSPMVSGWAKKNLEVVADAEE